MTVPSDRTKSEEDRSQEMGDFDHDRIVDPTTYASQAGNEALHTP